jgi:hypothetical protein
VKGLTLTARTSRSRGTKLATFAAPAESSTVRQRADSMERPDEAAWPSKSEKVQERRKPTPAFAAAACPD